MENVLPFAMYLNPPLTIAIRLVSAEDADWGFQSISEVEVEEVSPSRREIELLNYIMSVIF